MGTHSTSDSESPDTNAHIDATSPAADQPADTITWMYRNGKCFHVTEEEPTDAGTSTRKQLYLPKRTNSDDGDDEDDGLSEAWKEMCGEWDFEEDEMETCEEMSFSRLIHRYRHRWGIENGFKKQEHFMVRTTSTEREYRFFNFAFACVLYNVWRLVDLLVKLALDGENRTYKPLVDASLFLTVAKQWYGLDPPD